MKTENPLIMIKRIKRYRRMIDRRLKTMKRIDNEIWKLEAPYMRVYVSDTSFHFRYLVGINHKEMSREDRKRCKRLRNVRFRLYCSVSWLKPKITRIEERGQDKYGDFTWRLFELEVESTEAA